MIESKLKNNQEANSYVGRVHRDLALQDLAEKAAKRSADNVVRRGRLSLPYPRLTRFYFLLKFTYPTVADPDLQIREAAGHPDPERGGGGRCQKKNFFGRSGLSLG